MIELSTLKQNAQGRWPEILTTLGGVSLDTLDGKHHPCPKCGGKDRFRLLDADVGALFCNQCFSEKNGDGLSALQWLMNWDFPTVTKKLAEHLGIQSGNGSKKNSKAKRENITVYATAGDAVAELEKTHGKRSADWTYHNIQGEPVGVIVRWDKPTGKDIRPVSKIDGQWVIGGMPEPRPLYCLSEILDAERVYVCEGEKAADAARSIGLVATTSPHGSQSANKADWTPLIGKEIILLPDNDQAGKKYIDDVKAILAKLKPAPVVKVVNLPDLPDGGDIVDWIETHGDAADPDELRRQVETMVATAETLADESLPRFTKLITSAELSALDTRPEYLIHKVLPKNMPNVIGGRSKAMKTSIGLDGAISLGSGTPFLGFFETIQVKVAIWSGESGPPTIRAKALAIAESKGVNLSDCDVLWGFDLPKLNRDNHLDLMHEIFEREKIQVAIVDPLYLSLFDAQTAGQASNIYAMGSVLQGLSRLSQELGITLILLHHFKKAPQADDAEPCSLEQLSQAGIGEWARGWILLQRQSAYSGDGRHDLLMRVGSSVGYGGLYRVEIDEGVLGDDFTGRKWEVSVTQAGDFREDAKRREDARRAELRNAREAETLDLDRKEIVGAAVKLKDPESKTGLRDRVSCGHSRFNRAFASLVADGTLQQSEITKANGIKYPGWRARNED